jgi:lysozyme
MFTTLCLLAIAAASCVLAIDRGFIALNNPNRGTYPVRGVDVSAYQGQIDWVKLATQDVRFAFIKATEGSSFVDRQFLMNAIAAQKAGLAMGAYHFFSLESTGADQARHFINTLSLAHPEQTGVVSSPFSLPPVIDVELYGRFRKNPPRRDVVVSELTSLTNALASHYGRRPLIYATEESYDLYIAGGFPNCDIWIRNVMFSPSISDGRAWMFWQYSNR